MFWFFRLRFRRAYDSAYDSDFRFSLGHKLSYDSDYDSDSDSVASENQHLTISYKLWKSINRLKIRPLESNKKQITLPKKLGAKITATPADLPVPKDQKHLPFKNFSNFSACLLQEKWVSCKVRITIEMRQLLENFRGFAGRTKSTHINCKNLKPIHCQNYLS